MDATEVKKEHRARKAGAKARKKEEHQKKKKGLSTDRHNPRAFSVANVARTKKSMQRKLDRAQRKEFVPGVNRAEEVPPPAMIVVMGPKGCGKSTLIRSLVKYYTGQSISDVLGPITVVAGKKKRVTFFECPDDPCAMLDLAKVADMVLLMVDASFGFEMETFEFLNMLQIHGFPKVMGFLTHLDSMKTNKGLNKTKKRLKARFWTEIYQGAKMFYMSGVINNKYLKNEIRNVTLYISRMKYRPLHWRNTHPYVVVDRFEDITHPDTLQQNPNVERDVVLYGYVRGSHLKPSMKVHLIGAGDFDMESVDVLADPCPLPEKERSVLKSKETLLYAPMANVGAVKYDADAMYIDLRRLHYTKPDLLDPAARAAAAQNDDEDEEADDGAPAQLVRKLQDVSRGMDEKLKGAGVRLFAGGALMEASSSEEEEEEEEEEGPEGPDESAGEEGETSDEEVEEEGEEVVQQGGVGAGGGEEEEDDDEEDDVSGEDEGDEELEDGDDGGVGDGGMAFGDNYDDADEVEDGARWKQDLASRAALAFLDRQQGQVNLMDAVYGPVDGKKGKSATADSEDDGADDDGDFFRVKRRRVTDESGGELDALDSSKLRIPPEEMQDWSAEGEGSLIELLKKRFITGGWGQGEGELGEAGDGEGQNDGDDVYGDFEDLETGKVFKGKGGVDGEQSEDDEDAMDEEAKRILKKLQLKEKFDAEHDASKGGGKGKKGKGAEGDDAEEESSAVIEMAQKLRDDQQRRNKEEFGGESEANRLRFEGFRQGLYVRIRINGVSAEFSRHFRPTLPVVMGGLLAHETSLGMLRCRVKRHRWHRKVLKANDPLIFSIGWRRFQSIPLYSIEDQNERQRYLKYTPEHMHCIATFYGPMCPPNTGLLALQTLNSRTAGFRVSLTGTLLELNSSMAVQKKLKLVGYPSKIFKNTAFVRGMFNSDLEVAKFEGAKIRTVSGIRGQIKKAVGQGSERGTFRATFEDKVLISDIIFCRTWVPMEPVRFYNPVCSLLAADGEWQGMKTTAQVRRERLLAIPINKDSLYKPIERQERRFNKLVVPKSLQAQLPYASKPKDRQARKNKEKGYLKKRAVVMEPEERKKVALLQALATIRNEKVVKMKEKRAQKLVERAKKQAREQAKFEPMQREQKKRKYRDLGRKQAHAKKARGE